jgi:hypothetical protein
LLKIKKSITVFYLVSSVCDFLIELKQDWLGPVSRTGQGWTILP